jgi:hypothetical protein
MTTEVLRKKTGRYLCGLSMPAEKRQIQNWLSCTGDNKPTVPTEERDIIEDEIVAQVQAYVESSLFFPKQESWWRKVIASF